MGYLKINLLFLLFFSLISCEQSSKKELDKGSEKVKTEPLQILLIGTFHFANFDPKNNHDIVEKKVRDVLTKENQIELEIIANKIKEFNPDKIFVEYSFKLQNKLDSLFSSFSEKNFNKVSRNEIYQLAFRVAKKVRHKKLYAIDLRTNFPFDSLMTQMKKAKQFDLIAKDSVELVNLEKFENELFASNKSLTEILFYYNEENTRNEDVNWYLSLANQGGGKDNFVGSYLVSEWYRRNLYMYSIIQKAIKKGDSKIMILAGASHIAMFKDFIKYNPKWKTIELKELYK